MTCALVSLYDAQAGGLVVESREIEMAHGYAASPAVHA